MSKFNEIYDHEKTSRFSKSIFNSNMKLSCRFIYSLRGTKTSHFYLYLKFELHLTNLIVGYIIVHYCLEYEKFTLSLSVPTISRFIFLKS